MLSFSLLAIGSFMLGYFVCMKVSYFTFLKSQTDWISSIVQDDELYENFLEALYKLRDQNKKFQNTISKFDED